ncbi:hypothetical protein LY01_02483 [Nonlabens xylanidelens]|uniref:Uncharacterized protein n=1 Tax=Nonlabens xylanidelens TaxID=191564 RepID=A0A2S6IHL3_9FLAO|nr:hypothetical protein LY01_02483 [Nonlabens xylanidelens]
MFVYLLLNLRGDMVYLTCDKCNEEFPMALKGCPSCTDIGKKAKNKFIESEKNTSKGKYSEFDQYHKKTESKSIFTFRNILSFILITFAIVRIIIRLNK